MSYALIGKVERSGAVGGLRVEAWDAAGILGEMIDVAVTAANGAFEMELSTNYLRALLPQRDPVIAFRIFADGKPIAQTKAVVWTVAQRVTALRIPVTATTPLAGAATAPVAAAVVGPAHAVVRGAVVYGDGTPVAGAIVRAFDRNLGANGVADTQIGQATTGAGGGFGIEYGALASGKLKPDLVVQAFAAAGATTNATTAPARLLATSALVSNAPTVAIVELCTDAGIAAPIHSEHRAVAIALQPVLSRAKMTLADLADEHLELVAGSAGVTRERLRMMVDAAKQAKSTGGTIDAEVWYGVLRTGHVGGLAALLDEPISVVGRRLEQAMTENQLSAAFAPNLDALVTDFRDAVVAAALPANGAATATSRALGNALATPELQRAFLTAYVEREGSPAGVWAAIHADATLAPHAADLETTLRLQILFGGFQPALKELKARRQAGSLTTVRDLARWQDSDWRDLLTKVGTPPGTPGMSQADKVAAYAEGLAAVVRRSFPTEYLRGVASRPISSLSVRFLPELAAANPSLDPRRPLPSTASWGSIAVADRASAAAEWEAFRAEARSFRAAPARGLLANLVAGNGVNPLRAAAHKALLAAPDLDLEVTTVDRYATAHPTWLSGAGVTQTELPAVVGHLQALQRVVRLVDKPEAVETLVGKGLASALAISRIPRGQFVTDYADVLGGTTAAEATAARAYRVATTAQTALAAVAQAHTGSSPWSVRGGATTKWQIPDYEGALSTLQKIATAGDATWPKLFGVDSWCDCDDCQAAWGPAAYFVSLLVLLDPAHEANTPAQKLFERRPDLQYLPLTCDNVNTPIPVIDLANEVLETAAAKLLHVPVDVKSYDSTGIAPEVIRAVPQNVIDGVYTGLADAIYPFTLPFHRPLAVVRAYLEQLGTTYRDVVAAFGPIDDARLAAETFAMSAIQLATITHQRTGVELAAAYGYSGGSWQDELARVPTLLLRTGLSYDDLYAITWSWFVSPLPPATRPQLQAPIQCVIDQTTYKPPTDDTWDRLQRFVRLRAATPWSIADLDRALYSLGAKDAAGAVTLDEKTVVHLANLTRVIETLDLPIGTPIAAVLALWADIDTWGADSLYLARFANPTVAQLADGADPLALTGYQSAQPQIKGSFAPAGTGKPLDEVRPQLLAALGISATDLAAIRAHANQTTLSLGSLSALFRYTVLATGLQLRIADLVTLLELSGATPFVDPAATLDFIELANGVSMSGMSIAALAYIFRNTIVPGQGPAPAESVVLASLKAIWTGLRAVAQDTAVTDDPDGTLLATRLARIFAPAVVPQILAALDPATAPAKRAPIIALYLAPTIPEATNAIFGTPDPSDPVEIAARAAQNRAALLSVVSDWLRASLSRASVVSAVAGQLGLPPATTLPLLSQWIPGDSGSALDTLLGLAAGGLTLHGFAAPAFGGGETVALAPAVVSLQVVDAGTVQSVRWTGSLLADADGLHHLIVRTDGDGTLTIGAQELTFTHGDLADHVLDVTLSAGALVPITVEYDSGGATGRIDLLWNTPPRPGAAATPPLPITADYLFPSTGVTALDGASGPGFAWRRAHKAALLVGGLGLDAAAISYAQSAAQPFGAFALSALPMAEPADASVHALIGTFRQLARFRAIASALPTTTTLVDALTWTNPAVDPATQLAAWTAKLCAAGGWDPAVVEPLLDASSVDWTKSGTEIVGALLAPLTTDPTLPGRLVALETCIALVGRVGVDAATLRSWAATEPVAAAANAVIQAVRASYSDPTQWLSVAQTRNDSLRQLQRDALVAYLLPRLDVKVNGDPLVDANSLFEYFLLDIEMCACGQTSRVVQATTSAQLFIQRIQLDLEDGIPVTYIDPAKWEWQSEYRIWQANCEIFIYPENWIDPELRVDKTPLFTALQSQLAQSALDEDSIETAYLTYLQGLQDIARLEMCAMSWQYETSHSTNPVLAAEKTIDTLHVIAHSQGAHPTFYYRTLLGVSAGTGGSEWTPWQVIPVDILGDGQSGQVQMVATTYNRRLYLFWCLFTEVPEPDGQPGAKEGESPPPGLTHWEIRLGWTSYRDGAWAPKQITTSYLRSDRYIDDSAANQKSFATAIADYEHDLNKERAKYEDYKAQIEELESGVTLLLNDLGQKLLVLADQLVGNEVIGWDDLSTAETYAFTLAFGFYDEIEAACTQQQESVADLVSNTYDLIESWPATATGEDMLLSFVNAVVHGQKKVAKVKDRYDKQKDALAAFNSGKGYLPVPAYTERKDYTAWISLAHTEPRVYVARHDEQAHPLGLGYFELASDGLSVSTTSSRHRLDLTNHIPHHSDPDVNAFLIDTAKHKGLDLPGLPNLLDSVTAATYFDEHLIHHPVAHDHVRPFAIAKGNDIAVALPGDRQTAMPQQKAWSAAVPKGGFVYETVASPIDVNVGVNPVPTERTDLARIDTSPAAPVVGDRIPGNAYVEREATATGFGLEQVPVVVSENTGQRLFRFEPMRHPYVETLIMNLERDGVRGLLTIASQTPGGADSGKSTGYFAKTYQPSTKFVEQPYAVHQVDFRAQGSYGLYNWELFFHAPYLIASRLLTDGQYEAALRWLRYIFDPTTSSTDAAPGRYWNLQWFRDHDAQESATELMTALATNAPAAVAAEVRAEIEQWNLFPADPHRIARLRTSAYQKAIVFKYLDVLIAWGDSLFAQNTLETINQATQLYVLASHLLGPRPEHVPQTQAISPFCYDDMRGVADQLGDTVESMLHPDVVASSGLTTTAAHAYLGITHLPVVFPSQAADPTLPQSPLVFCIPANSKLMGYFDTLDDRLFKIRHCMNMSGVVQQLPLFQPPIDPALLVQAAALGLDLASVLANLSSPLPFQRFTVTYGKAVEMAGDLRAFGSLLLATLEKQDAEALALLRATHETTVQSAILAVKQQQVKDAETARTALQKSRDMVQAKHDYYASRPYMNAHEGAQQTQMGDGASLQRTAGLLMSQASEASMMPSYEIGPTGMGFHAALGGPSFADALRAISESLGGDAQATLTTAQAAGILGSFERRADDWKFQTDQTKQELAQLDEQIASANIRIAIANLDVQNQQLQISNANKVEDTLRAKYTSTELYQWMVGQVATTYYGAYKVAYDLAQRAERCYQYELGISDSGFIRFGYWDSLRKGLLAGEQLALDLRRLEASYLQNNRRYYEITRQISLVLHDPAAFMQLRDTGSCTFSLPETLFDADYPGHYFRRIQNVALTLPCVAGPYTPINCTLTLLSSAVRTTATPPANGNAYPEANPPNDPRFSHNYGAIQSVATSHGQNDAGLFEVNFRDERYLPFEGAGAISTWRLDLPADTNAFDYDTLADVVMKLSYTARDGGAPLAATARSSLATQRATISIANQQALLQRMYRVRYEFSDAWLAFRTAAAAGPASLALVIDSSRFPFLFRGNKLGIAQIDLHVASPSALVGFDATLTPPGAGTSATPLHFTTSHTGATVVHAALGPINPTLTVKSGADATWTLAVPANSPLGTARDLFVVVTYVAAPR